MMQNIEAICKRRQKLIQEHLIEPLKERACIRRIDDIVGQDDAVLKILNDLRRDRPRDIVLIGPKGTGKKDILRACFKKVQNEGSNFFEEGSKFIEYYPEKTYSDGLIYTTLFGYLNEIDCVTMKIQRLKIGLVTRANKGILYINNIKNIKREIILKLMEVVKEKKITFNEACVLKETPEHVKHVLINGLPADFCLAVNADEIESLPQELINISDMVFFREQNKHEIKEIIKNTARKGLFGIQENICDEIADIARNGEDAVRILQHVALNALKCGRSQIMQEDIESLNL